MRKNIRLKDCGVNGRQRIDDLCMLLLLLKPCFLECPFSLLIFLLLFNDLVDQLESHYDNICIINSSEIILIIMLYAIFYTAICTNIVILLGKYSSDIFYIQCFLYSLLIIRMNVFTHPLIHNSIKWKCLIADRSDHADIIVVVES